VTSSTNINQHTSQKPLEQRVFGNSYFAVSWVVFLAAVIYFVSWPLRNVALVCWTYGTRGYFQDGIRVLSGKPVHFSNGVPASSLPDFVTGAGAVLGTFFGLTFLLVSTLRMMERHRLKAGS